MHKDYIEFEGRHMMAVRCKGDCETVIAFAPRIGDAIKPTEDYSELTIVLEEPNGALSKHETGVCAACKQELLDTVSVDRVRDIYAQDVHQWQSSALRQGQAPRSVEEMGRTMAERTPLYALDDR